jgi:DNA-binding GntR family transcriptional regulator
LRATYRNFQDGQLMRTANNRGSTKAGPAVASPWLPETAPPTAARESKQRPDRLADVAHSKLEELIVTMELLPGSLWSEAMLSDRIGIGRTPVREAVQRLAWERLLTIIRRHGIRISDIDPHEQMLVLELRKEFEPLVASRAARRATVDERRYLSKIANSFMEAGATVDVMKFLRVHFESKRFIISCARNPFIANAFAPINALTRRFYFVYQRETKDVARAAALHAAVLKGIASGDEVAAADAARAMVDYAEYYTRSVITGRTTI